MVEHRNKVFDFKQHSVLFFLDAAVDDKLLHELLELSFPNLSFVEVLRKPAQPRDIGKADVAEDLDQFGHRTACIARVLACDVEKSTVRREV